MQHAKHGDRGLVSRRATGASGSWMRQSTGTLFIGIVIACGAGGVAAQGLPPDSTPALDVSLPGLVRAVATAPNAAAPTSATFVGGRFDAIAGQSARNFARVTSAGIVDPAWRHDVDGDVHAIAVTSTGDVYIGGSFLTIDGVPRNRLARFQADGTLDTGWNLGAEGGIVYTLAIDAANARLYIGGRFDALMTDSGIVNREGGAARVVLGSGPAVVDAWNPGGLPDGEVHAFAIDPGNDAVYVGGNFIQLGGLSSRHLVKLSATTAAADPGFTPAPDAPVLALARYAPLSGGAALVVGGRFTSIAGQSRERLAQFSAAGTLAGWNPGADDEIRSLSISVGGAVLVAGRFSTLGGLPLARVARFASPSASAPDAVDLAIEGEVLDARWAGISSAIRIGGEFARGAGQDCLSLLRLASISVAQDCADAGRRGEVRAMESLPDGRWVIGGSFAKVKGAPVRNLARTTTGGAVDPSWQPQPDGLVNALLRIGDRLYAGGQFTHVDGQPRGRLARFDASGALDPSWAPAADAGVNVLVADGSTHLYAGGAFTTIDSTPRNRVARLALDGAPLIDPDFAPDTMSGAVLAMALDPAAGGRLYVGGEFLTPSSPFARLMRLDRHTGARDPGWQPLANQRVRALALDTARGGLYVGGDFTALGNYSSWSYFGKVQLVGGSTDTTWLTDPRLPTGTVHALHLANDGALYLGGRFTALGGVPQAFAARLTFNEAGRATVDEQWNPRIRTTSATAFGDSSLVQVIRRDAYGTVAAGGSFQTVSGEMRMGSAFFTDAGDVTLTYLAGPNGTLSGPTTQVIAFGGSGEAVTAHPDPGHYFDGWSDGSHSNPRIDSDVMDDLAVTASFEPHRYTLGGTVTGLAGSGLQLANASQTLPVSANGPFSFAGTLPSGSSYAVTVAASPASPAQTCVVERGSGTIVAADVDDVQVTCTTVTHVVSLAATGSGTLTAWSGQGFGADAVPDGSPLRIEVSPAAGHAIGSVSGCGGSLDGFVYTTAPVTADCTVSASFVVAIREVDLGVTLDVDVDEAKVGDSITFTLAAANSGVDDSSAAVLSIDASATLESLEWRCEPAVSTTPCPAPGSGSGGFATTVDLPAGATLVYTIEATVAAGETPPALQASITASAQESDTHPSNNSATAQVALQEDPAEEPELPELLRDGFESR